MKTLELFEYPLYWEMTNNEKIVLLHLLEEIKPNVSIEIGCKEGGSLQLIAEYSREVYSLDINPEVTSLENKFPNVNFIIGDSKETLPKLLQKLSMEEKSPDFILIDGEHSTEGVLGDINAILAITVTKPLTVIMHDSFNPNCRKGMLSANYTNNKHIHFADIDFLQGTYSVSESVNGEMWGGFGIIVLHPERNEQVPEIRQSLKYSFERTLRLSRHFNYNNKTFSDRVKSYILKKFFI
ncbi:MAG: class I SAM-dependent methyltransferase [Ginsengibacter sp.]